MSTDTVTPLTGVTRAKRAVSLVATAVPHFPPTFHEIFLPLYPFAYTTILPLKEPTLTLAAVQTTTEAEVAAAV